MDAGERALFERSLRHLTGQRTGDTLDAALAEAGWHEAMADDPEVAVPLLFELQGAANATSSALGAVVARGLGPVGGGAGVVLPAPGRWDPPGTVTGGALRVEGVGCAALARTESAVVVASDGGGVVAVTVPTALLALRPLGGVDPGAALCEVRAEGLPAAGGPGDAAAGWESAVALGRLAVGHELLGLSRTMLELACRHAVERVQFGRPIGSFQAVRHRLAEALVAAETAGALLGAAWIDGTPVSAAMAKATAGRQAKTVARHCQQVLAGVGFTMEHPFHRYLRRMMVLDALFGTSSSVTRSLGARTVDRRLLPPLLAL